MKIKEHFEKTNTPLIEKPEAINVFTEKDDLTLENLRFVVPDKQIHS